MYPGIDPGALWRSRQWRKLLNLIDHLPQNTWYQAAVSMDEEHAEMVLEAQAQARKSGQPDPGPPAPSLATWSPEVDMTSRAVNALKEIAYILMKANNGSPKEPKPVPRPTNAMEVARLRRKQRDHESLKSRLLPGGSTE